MFTDAFMFQVILVPNFSVERESCQQGIRQGASGNTVSQDPTASDRLVFKPVAITYSYNFKKPRKRRQKT